jgi:hypothetical protein
MIGGTDPDPAILCWFLQIRIRNTVQYWCLITSLSTAVCAIVAVDIYRYCITCFLLFTYRMDQTIQPTLYVFANPKFYKIFRKVIIIIVFNFCFFSYQKNPTSSPAVAERASNSKWLSENFRNHIRHGFRVYSWTRRILSMKKTWKISWYSPFEAVY